MERATNKAERLLQIEALLLAHPEGLTQSEIARRLKVNRSTIYRYLPDLGKFSIHETGDGKLAIDRDHYLANVRLTMHEAMAVHLAARLMATRTDKHNPHAASALRKLGLSLEKLAPLISAHLIASAGVMDDEARRHDPVYQEALETLTRAWSLGRKVWLKHQMPDQRVFEYTFAPYFIEPYAVGQTSHVIGWREPPGALRTFKIERIKAARILDQLYTIPADFDPREKLADAWGIWYTEAEPVEVVLRFHPRVVQRVRETRWHHSESVDEQPDGSLIWRAWVAEPREMLPWIRGWGADVEVFAPDGLRVTLVREVQKMARVYDVVVSESDLILERLLCCWGKTGRDSYDFHPVIFHMLDVGHVAKALLQPPASPRWRDVLARALGMPVETLLVWLPYFVALHDIGKISAAFQGMKSDQKIRLKAEGLTFKPWRRNLDMHHTQIGQAAAQYELDLSLPDDIEQTWIDVIGAHHGRFQAPRGARNAQVRLQRSEPPHWKELRAKAAHILQQHFLGDALPALPETCNISTATMALTGFTILCDWLGSDERFFSPRADLDLTSYTEESRARARRAVEQTGFFRPPQSKAPTTFAALFPDKHVGIWGNHEVRPDIEPSQESL